MNIHIFLFCCLIKKTERRRRAGRKKTISHRGEWWSRVERAATSPWQLIYRRDGSRNADEGDEGFVASTWLSLSMSSSRTDSERGHVHRDIWTSPFPCWTNTSVSPRHFIGGSQRQQLMKQLPQIMKCAEYCGPINEVGMIH